MSENDSNNGMFVGDLPVDAGNDKLQFKTIAKVLADGLTKTADPVTVGVFGKWGTGKTSLMQIVKDRIDEEKKNNITTVWFNAWQYEKEDHLIVPLVATINNSLKKSHEKEITPALKEGIKKMSNALRSIAYGFSVKGKVGIPLFSEAEVNLSPKDMIERYQELSKDTILSRSLYFEAFEELSSLVKDEYANKTKNNEIEIPRIIIFVDDLDRCFPDKAVNLLEHIKLVLTLPKFAFVLGVNREVIQEAVEAKYKNELKIDIKHCKEYLEKIVQVQINVPVREPGEMTKYIQGLIANVETFDKVKDKEYTPEDVVVLVAEAGKRNPRAIVRLLNRITVISRINNLEREDDPGKEEYDPVAVLMYEAMDDANYKNLVSNLTTIITDQDNQQMDLGMFLAVSFESYKEDQHNNWIYDIKESGIKRMKSTVLLSLEVFKDYPHLCRILKTKIGRKWLREKDFRKLGASSKEIEDKEVKPARLAGGPLTFEEALAEIEANMVEIPGGTFQMGSDEDDAKPVHPVTIKTFKISAIPVTQAQYQAVIGFNPSKFKGPDNPVDSVLWEDADEFCRRLNERLQQQTGGQYGLPSEAQWEYACRAGNSGKYCFGDDENMLGEYAWFDGNSEGKAHPVGQKTSNTWGLYDMHGNVWEWCEDDYHPHYNKAPDDGSAWIDNPRADSRVLRGGSWFNNPSYCRSDFRRRIYANDWVSLIGFRLVLVR